MVILTVQIKDCTIIYKQLGFNTYHVGVDENNFTPISLDEIWERMK